MNDIISISGVRGYIDENGVAHLNAGDVARGWGFIQNQIKNGKQYTSIRWETLNRYLQEFGFPQNVGENDFIPENMVYRLGFKASNEAAQRFQALLANEVLPAIRKHGAYLTPEKLEEVLLTPDTLIQIATNLKEERAKRERAEKQIQLDKPKVLFAESVAASKDDILINDLAKIITQNGYEIGEKRLYKWMRDNGYLIKRKGSDYNSPVQKWAKKGLFRITEMTINHNSGLISKRKTTRVTGKGEIYFVALFKEKIEAQKAGVINLEDARVLRS